MHLRFRRYHAMRLVSPIAFVTLISIYSSASAGLRYEAGAGVAIPIAPKEYRKAWSPGPHVALAASFDCGSQLECALVADLSGHPLKEMELGERTTISGGSLTLLSFTTNLRAFATRHTSSVVPFVSAGAGFHYMAVGELKIEGRNVQFELPQSSSSAIAVIEFGIGVKAPIAKSVESLLQLHVLESFRPDSGVTSRTAVIRIMLRPTSTSSL